jgi:phosphatidylglycerophosphate synthase
VSPNVITLSGVLALSTGALILHFYDSKLEALLPNWLYIYLICMVWVFSTMDAVDGKHARNTNRASPLGQLVDHGLDCFSYAFTSAYCIIGLRVGSSWGAFLLQAFAYSLYYSHTWEEYYSGVFSTQEDNVGVTEFQILASILIASTMIFGAEAPLFKVFGIQCNNLFCFALFSLGIFTVYKTIMKTLEKIPKEKKTIDVLYFFLPHAVFIYSLFCLQFLEVFKQHTLEFVVLNGLVFAFLSSEQIIATTSKSKYIFISQDLTAYAIVITLSLFLDYNSQLKLMLLFSFISSCRYIQYVVSLVRQLMDFLKVDF